MKWFKHDANASLDAKLQKVRLKYGMEGYGLYWFCLEAIARNVEKHNLTFSLEEDAELISSQTSIHYERVQEMMLYMVKLGLFEECQGIITCLKMASRTDEYTQKLIRDEGFVPTQSGQTRDALPRKSELIEENRTEQNRKEIGRKSSRFTPPTLKEISDYVLERGSNVDPEKFHAHYETVNWYRGKTKIKDWKACVRTWESRDDAKPAKASYGGYTGVEI